ncbi:MAG: TIGR00730 family Rossman fold protein [Burkholderiales bacterium]
MNEPADGRPPLAYKNEPFLDSDDARPLRILSEYLQPLYAFERQRICGTIVFFGSARLRPDGPLGEYYEAARDLARRVTAWSEQVSPEMCHYAVCTGGGGGIMEAANRGALEAGGKSIGLNIGLPHEQQPNGFTSPDLAFEFHYFFMRKLWFAHLAHGLVVFPGGFGTLDELMEMLTLMQTGKIRRRVPVVLYGTRYWNEILDFDALVRHGMIDATDLAHFRFADEPAQALALLQAGVAPLPDKAPPVIAHSRTP